MEDHATATRIEQLADDIVRDLRSAEYGDEYVRARAIEAAAQKIVDLRELHVRADGSPDWAGRSWAYRSKMTEIYNAANLDPRPNSNTKAALRYHVANNLRERLSEDELEDAGLKQASPRDRAGMRYRSEADDAEFMKGVFLHLLRTPSLPLPEEQTDRATRLGKRLQKWLAAHH